MSAAPPRAAAKLLARALRRDPAGPVILGDLLEDFAKVHRARGARVAWLWYWKEAVMLSMERRATGASPAPGPGGPASRRSRVRELLQDGAFALRAVRRTPGFTLFIAVLIALGVGAATSVFSVLRPLVLAPLPLERPHELVWIANEPEPGDTSLSAVTSRTDNLLDFRERSRTLAGLTGYNAFFDHSSYALTGAGEPERLAGVGVAPDFLDVLGIEPVHGRRFTPDEGAYGGPPAVILSHGFWTRRFAGDPGVVGRSLTLNGRPHLVVGVLPSSFDFSSMFTPGVTVDFLVPFPIDVPPEVAFVGNVLAMVGRLRDGETAASAQAELDVILSALREEDPGRWGLGARVTTLRDHLAGPFRPALVLLAAAAATLLLIVCVNVSNLFLARTPARAREIAVRKAFGAARGRIARQLVLEATCIALAGALLGTAVAAAAVRVVAGPAGASVPLLDRVQVDGWALLFAIGTAALTGLLVGIVPALQVRDGNEASVLRAAAPSTSASRGARRLRDALVIAEVTLACVLLVAGGLLVRSFRAVLDVELGFDPSNAVAWQLEPSGRFGSLGEKSGFYAGLADRVAAVPGIEDVGLTDALPLGRNRSWSLRVVGQPEPTDGPEEIFPHVVNPGYLPAMRIPIVAGRNLTRDDREDAPPVVLMNESGARRVFRGADPLGRRVRLWGPWEWEVVGIVRDVRHLSPELDAGTEVYFPLAQMPDYQALDLVVRSSLPADQVARDVSAALREVDPAMPTGRWWTVGSTVDRAVSARRFTLGILSAYGLTALLLAGLGVYGVLAQVVAERRPEIGIRLALGASSSGIVRSVMGRTLALAGLGILAGAAIALGGARLLESLLFEVGPRDPLTFAGMALVLLTVAALGGAVPAARAGRTRVAGVLRGEG